MASHIASNVCDPRRKRGYVAKAYLATTDTHHTANYALVTPHEKSLKSTRFVKYKAENILNICPCS